MYAIIDAGGTNTRIGITTHAKEFKEVIRYSTPQTFPEFSKKLCETLKSFGQHKSILFGVAGFVDHHENKVIKAPHIPYLDGKTVKDIFPDLDCEIKIENDATLAGLAEATSGEGKNFNRVAYVTISTGVGGTLIVDRKIPDTRYNYEPGHHIINFHGNELAVRNIKGSWESFSSGTGFTKRYGVNPIDYHDPALWAEYGEILAVGFHNLTLLWQPEVIVIGGSMSKKSHLFLKPLISALDKSLPAYTPEIRISALGDTNGLTGGLEYLKTFI